MFIKMRRFKQQISDEKCVEILTNEPRGVLALYGENGRTALWTRVSEKKTNGR